MHTMENYKMEHMNGLAKIKIKASRKHLLRHAPRHRQGRLFTTKAAYVNLQKHVRPGNPLIFSTAWS